MKFIKVVAQHFANIFTEMTNAKLLIYFYDYEVKIYI